MQAKTKPIPSKTYHRFNRERYLPNHQAQKSSQSIQDNLPLITTRNGFLQKYLIHNIKYSTMSKIIYRNSSKNQYNQPTLQNNVMRLSYSHQAKQSPKNNHINKAKYFFSNPQKINHDSQSILLKQVRKTTQNQMSLLRRIISQLKINDHQKPTKRRIRQMPIITNYNQQPNSQKKQVCHPQPVVIINKHTTNQALKNKRQKNRHHPDLHLPNSNKRSQNTYSPWNNMRQSKDQWDYRL